MNIKVISWNVNGIRACGKKGFFEWMQKSKAQVVCLQETKAHPEQLPQEWLEPKGYDSYFASAKKKGYSGVAVYVSKKYPPISVTEGLGIEKYDSEGRTLIIEFEDFVLINGYFPNGQRDHGRVPYKLAYSQEVADQALKLKKKLKKEVIVCGDFNTAHYPVDLANPKTNTKSTGFLPIEREWLDSFVEQGFSDIFREHHKDEVGHYTWWTYRSNCRERNIGWRLDYFFGTKKILPKVKTVSILPEVLGSDHCPIELELKF